MLGCPGRASPCAWGAPRLLLRKGPHRKKTPRPHKRYGAKPKGLGAAGGSWWEEEEEEGGFVVVAPGPAFPRSSAPTRPLEPLRVRAAVRTAHGDPPALRFGVFCCARSRCSPRAPCVCRAAYSHPQALSAPGLIRLGSTTPPGQLPRGLGVPRGTKAAEISAHPGVPLPLGHAHPPGRVHTHTRM